MLLAVDIGNTNTVAGVYDADQLIVHWRFSTDQRRMADEYGALTASLFQLADLDTGRVRGAVVAGVVPGAQSEVLEAIERYLGVRPLIVSADLDLGIEVHYATPHSVGADRLANAVAAVDSFGAPAIVVDFGTGTNFDVVDLHGAYIGGAIAPGLEISMNALFSRAAQLPQVPLRPPDRAVGTSTLTALQSGIVFGYAGLVDGLVRRLSAELEGDAHVVATGGLASVVAPHAATVQHIDPDLTLSGLRLIYERNRPD